MSLLALLAVPPRSAMMPMLKSHYGANLLPANLGSKI